MPLLAGPKLAPSASSARVRRLWAARYSQGEAQPLGARPPPWGLKRAVSKVADFTAFVTLPLTIQVREGALLRPAMRLVMADFLIRHGVITPDNEPDYEQIILALHQQRLVI